MYVHVCAFPLRGSHRGALPLAAGSAKAFAPGLLLQPAPALADLARSLAKRMWSSHAQS